MNIKTIGAFGLASVLFTGAANAGNMLFDFYAGATVGAGAASFLADDSETKNSQSYGLVAGLDIPALRFEAEYNYINNDIAKTNIGMVNAYFKMPSTVVHPYLGVGVGAVFGGSVDISGVDIDTGAAYQGMLGLTFDIPVLPIKIDTEGRVLYAPDIFQVGNQKPDLLQYDARIKLRYIF